MNQNLPSHDDPEEYEILACKVLGLAHPTNAEGIHLDIGTFRPIDSLEATKHVAFRRAERVQQYFQEMERKTKGPNPRLEREKTEYLFLRLGKFLQKHKDMDADFSTPDARGYAHYIETNSPATYRYLSMDIPVLLPERDRKTHTYIAAGTGSGKTELLKLLVYETLKAKHAAVVLIDPLGSFARPVSRWAEFSDRLVYIDPTLFPDALPSINPLSFAPLSSNPTDQEDERDAIADEINQVFRQLIEAQDGQVSDNMETVLIPCLKVLLTYPGATFRHLQQFMNDGQNSEFLKAAARYPFRGTGIREFFETTFEDKHLATTRRALNVKLQRFVTNRIFSSLLCRESSVPLEKLINEKKLIVFNLQGVPGKLKSQFGRFIVATVQAIGHRRTNIDERVPCHFFVDEAGMFFTSSIVDILRQGRQLGMHLTMAQQELGGDMPPGMVNAVLGGSTIKIIGRTEGGERSPGPVVGVSANDLRYLEPGEFFLKNGRSPTVKLTTWDDLLGNEKAMSAAEWEKVKEKQRIYYRPLTGDTIDEQPSQEMEDWG